MSLGSWDPEADNAAQNISIDAATVERFIGYSRQNQLDQLPDLLGLDESQRLAGLMQLDHTLWQAAAEALADDDIVHLIRFFAMAENLPGWEAGDKSPVIALARTLRKRGQRLEKPLLLWLRQVNENRFLPYGPL